VNWFNGAAVAAFISAIAAIVISLINNRRLGVIENEKQRFETDRQRFAASRQKLPALQKLHEELCGMETVADFTRALHHGSDEDSDRSWCLTLDKTLENTSILRGKLQANKYLFDPGVLEEIQSTFDACGSVATSQPVLAGEAVIFGLRESVDQGLGHVVDHMNAVDALQEGFIELVSRQIERLYS